MTKTIAILNATSAQSNPLVGQALEKKFKVRAFARNAQKLDDTFADHPNLTKGHADLSDQASLVAAFAGVNGAFVHLPIPQSPELPGLWLQNIIAATQKSELSHLVFSTSGPSGSRYASTPMIEGTNAAKSAIEAANVPVTILMPSIYLENMQVPPFVPQLHSQGILTYPPVPADMNIAFTSHADQARYALAAFEKPELIGETIEIASKPMLSGAELAKIFSKTLDRSVKFEPLTPEQFGTQIGEVFQSPEVGQGLAELYQSISALGKSGMEIDVAALEQKFSISLPTIAEQIASW